MPSASARLIKALNERPRDRKKEKNIKHNGSITMKQIIDIARDMRSRSMARKLKGTVLEILGTALSIGCFIEGQSPREIVAKIRSGEISIPEE
jgi:large subunit ribosomal protein L12e